MPTSHQSLREINIDFICNIFSNLPKGSGMRLPPCVGVPLHIEGGGPHPTVMAWIVRVARKGKKKK